MKLKGIELPVNTVIILVVAILVLVLIVYMVIKGTDMSLVTNQDAFNRGCRVYIEEGRLPSTIMLGDITNDGKEDSLLTVCRLHYMDSSMDDEGCREKCREVFPFGEVGDTGGVTTCPTGADASGYCFATDTGSLCSGNCYCSDSTTCSPLKNDGVGCSKSYECKTDCCNEVWVCSAGKPEDASCEKYHECLSGTCTVDGCGPSSGAGCQINTRP
ncbi:MAG: hypothetical protein KAT28_03245 [Candidatus Aenigmarchaeota archaeon]|nr:hypothetical protein [Candidatus Aenigmarchaeota archaeon]